jgi:hypothetical protein
MAATLLPILGLPAAPGQAAPPPEYACQGGQWVLPSSSLTVDVAENDFGASFFHVDWNGSAPTGPATSVYNGGASTKSGHAYGVGTRPDGTIDFTIDWDGGVTNHLFGLIGGGYAKGQLDKTPATGGWPHLGWGGEQQFQCVQNSSAPAQKATATVTNDVDVYAHPGGNDQDKIGFITARTLVNLPDGQSCPHDDWCHISGPKVPTGDGYAWGAFFSTP